MNTQKRLRRWLKAVDTSTVGGLFRKYGKVCIVGVCFVSLLLVVYVIQGHSRTIQVSFLDVGQGDSVYIRTPGGHDMLVDGGPNDMVVGRLSRVMPFFDRDIDVVVATHPDADHVTGLIPVFGRYTVHSVLTSPVSGHTGVFSELERVIQGENAEVVVARVGTVIDFGDGVVAKVLYPNTTAVTSDDTNDYSVSIVLTYGQNSFLLTGDLPALYEGDLIRNGLPENVTVYKAGHHGSRTSSGETLLSYMKPEYVVISAGKDNTYGHPHKETLERLSRYAKEVLSTIDKGTITFTADEKSVILETGR